MLGNPTKPVVTLTHDQLSQGVRQLWDQVVDDGFRPDAILGIASGGAIVAGEMAEYSGVPVANCTLQRPYTSRKARAGAGARLLRRLPYPVTDWLRRTQDYTGSRKQPQEVAATTALVKEVGEIVRAWDEHARRIVIVDDAVDSGATLSCVRRTLAELVPAGVEIRTAAITQTRLGEKTLIEADYRLFETTLCRFPWADDFKSGR